jgi:hypothetical protein
VGNFLERSEGKENNWIQTGGQSVVRMVPPRRAARSLFRQDLAAAGHREGEVNLKENHYEMEHGKSSHQRRIRIKVSSRKDAKDGEELKKYE